MGVLLATGLIVGESLFGVAFAGIVAGDRASDRPSCNVLGEDDPESAVPLVRVVLFALVIASSTSRRVATREAARRQPIDRCATPRRRYR